MDFLLLGVNLSRRLTSAAVLTERGEQERLPGFSGTQGTRFMEGCGWALLMLTGLLPVSQLLRASDGYATEGPGEEASGQGSVFSLNLRLSHSPC